MRAARTVGPPRRAGGDQGERPAPREGGPPERFDVERASASPRLPAPAPSRRRAPRPADLAPVAGPLGALTFSHGGTVVGSASK